MTEIVRPSVDDVAALLRARTKTGGGDELGTFTPETRPSDVEVQRLIILAESDVSTQCGVDLASQTLADSAASMIALRAACFVELSYWPEQVRSDRSAYHELWRMYEAGMTSLLAAVEAGGESGVSDRFAYGTIPVRSWATTPPYDWNAVDDAPTEAAP